MDFFKTIEKRRSVRAYTNTPIEQKKLEQVLRAAQLAPTACNYQPYKIIVISTERNKEALKNIYKRDWFVEPPYVLLICADTDKCWKRSDGKSYGDVDSAIVMDHIVLAATAEGLGTCWIAAFDAKATKEAFSLPDNMEPIAFATLGYARDSKNEKVRKDQSDLIQYI